MTSKASQIAERCKRHGSQGGKVVRCVRCGGDIPPYAGRKVAELRETYAHHPGQCTDAEERSGTLRKVAQQSMFAWECTHIEPGTTEPEICSIAGTEPTAYLEHMKREHGATQLRSTAAPVRLRKGVPAAARQAPIVAPFKKIAWTEKHAGPWSLEGQETWTTEHRGQFWANGPDSHSVIAIEDMRGTGRPNRLVTLYVRPDGSVTPDWSDAKHSRREANAAARRAAERSARAA
jgi:hypothetical protein